MDPPEKGKQTKFSLKIGSIGGKWEGSREVERGEESEGSEKLSWVKGGRPETQREKQGRNTLKEGNIVGLARNQALGKLPGNHKDDPS